jgi:hypothetical protein
MQTDPDLCQLADRAAQIFLAPSHRYPWADVMTGCAVSSADGMLRQFRAVDRNTFRALHREDKSEPVGEPFIGYFVQHRDRLVPELLRVASRAELDRISDEIAEGLRGVLGHLKASVLAQYHKLRKPVDLALECLVTISVELDAARETLVPLLFLPLDSQMFGQKLIFTDAELARFGLTRESGFGEVRSREAYLCLQDIVARKAAQVSQVTGQPFHPAYFDLLWGGRYRNWGGNLFETIPERTSRPAPREAQTRVVTRATGARETRTDSWVAALVRRRPELKTLRGHIGENLADNYVKGLNGVYANRLQRGVELATGLPSDRLVPTIRALMGDRSRLGDHEARALFIPVSEEGRRALVLGLWSSRELAIRRGEVVDIGGRKRRVYGDENYAPQA